MSTELINALQNPALYDHPVEAFQVLETHISWVILTGDYAYKIKKPMDFGFLNFTTLEKRSHFCQQEVKLNQRLAPQLYLDVLPITGSVESPVINGEGEAFEYVIKMRQFPQDGLLDKLQEAGELNTHHIDRLGDIIATFHKDIAIAPEDSEFGQPEQVFAPMQQNFDQVRPLLEDPELLAQLDQLEAWTQCTYERLKPLLAERKRSGYIRECHGDIHLGNITTYQDDVVLFDCIEFNDEFRWTDVTADIAFLIMDLEDRKQQGLANRFLNRYLEQTGDYQALNLLAFYKAYRAMVRAKVSLFMMGSPDLDEEGKANLLSRYQDYANLAESCSSLPNRYVLMMHGVAGSGKTTVGNELISELCVIRIRSDVERKRLFNLEATSSSDSPLDGGIYTQEASQKTYDKLGSLCQTILASGLSALVDATNLKTWQRDMIANVAEENGVPFVIVSCQAEKSVIESWIKNRIAEGSDASEADLEVLEQQLASQEPLTEEEQSHAVVIKTQQKEDTAKLVTQIKKHLGL